MTNKHQRAVGACDCTADYVKREIIRRANRKRNLMVLAILLFLLLLCGAFYGVFSIVANNKDARDALGQMVDEARKKADDVVSQVARPTTVFDRVKDNIAIVNVANGRGTGFIAEMEGRVYLFTNEHVIRSTSRPTAMLIDGTELKLGSFYLSTDRDLARYEVLNGLRAKPLRIRMDTPPPAISHRNTRCVDRAGKYFLEYAA